LFDSCVILGYPKFQRESGPAGDPESLDPSEWLQISTRSPQQGMVGDLAATAGDGQRRPSALMAAPRDGEERRCSGHKKEGGSHAS
jgi:hypothetical protein